MLCGVSVVFNSLGEVLGLMSCTRSFESSQVFVGFQSAGAFGCLHHAGGGPAPALGREPVSHCIGREPGRSCAF